MRCVWQSVTVSRLRPVNRAVSVPAVPSSQEVLIREAHNQAWPEVNLHALQVEKVGRRVRQHVNPFKEELQVPLAPVSWKDVFKEPSLPLSVDIGCGPGRYLLASSKRHPGNNFLGLEIRQPLIDRANDWARAMGVQSQVHFMYANANVQLQGLLKSYPGPVHLVTIQFPDPHWKAKHKKRRIVQPALVQTIRDALPTGGKLFMQSDVLEVADAMWSEVDLAAPDAFELDEGNKSGRSAVGQARSSSGSLHAWQLQNPIGVSTEREVVSEELGLPVYRVLFVKK